MSPNSQTYKEIISSLIPHFAKLYKHQIPRSKLPTETRINCGDCFLMAFIVYHIALQCGLKPVIHAGSHHVWVMEDDHIFDVYFPEGITQEGVKNLSVNIVDEEDGIPEPPFYHGSAISDVYQLHGYFFNNPDRLLFAEYILYLYGVPIPQVGLNQYKKRNSRYRLWNKKRDAMRRYLKRVGNEKVGLCQCKP